MSKLHVLDILTKSHRNDYMRVILYEEFWGNFLAVFDKFAVHLIGDLIL